MNKGRSVTLGVVFVALASTIALPIAAQAETSHEVEMTSGRAICRATVDDGIACHFATKPRWINLTRNGETTVRANGANTIPKRGNQFGIGLIPRSGQFWKKNGVRCKSIGKDSKTGFISRRWGVYCSNGSHSFRLEPHHRLKTT